MLVGGEEVKFEMAVALGSGYFWSGSAHGEAWTCFDFCGSLKTYFVPCMLQHEEANIFYWLCGFDKDIEHSRGSTCNIHHVTTQYIGFLVAAKKKPGIGLYRKC